MCPTVKNLHSEQYNIITRPNKMIFLNIVQYQITSHHQKGLSLGLLLSSGSPFYPNSKTGQDNIKTTQEGIKDVCLTLITLPRSSTQ